MLVGAGAVGVDEAAGAGAGALPKRPVLGAPPPKLLLVPDPGAVLFCVPNSPPPVLAELSAGF